MGSQKQHMFSEVPRATIQRSQFNRSSTYKTTFDAGQLVPMFLDEVLPGDTFNLQTAAFARLATPIYPVMDNMYMETFYFFVPLRLIWDNFQRFMGEQANPADSTDYLVPQMSPPAGGYPEQSLQDYMGIPTKVDTFSHSALPLRAYGLIFNEWFRDQNLTGSLIENKGNGPDDPTDIFLVRRSKKHDYFTSALPWPQKGPAVDLPLGQSAPVTGTAQLSDGPRYDLFLADDAEVTVEQVTNNLTVAPTNSGANLPFGLNFSEGRNINVSHDLSADLSQAVGPTINSLRLAFQVQKLYERDARGGTRYTEIVLSHFGVSSPDARLQRPEFLGGGSTMVNVSPVASTTDLTSVGGTEDGTIGRLSGIGTASFRNHGFVKSFTEHGLIIGLINVRADLTYQQGLDRMWSRQDRLEFFFPVTAHLGEQEILNKEIYLQTDGAPENEDVFGYQERFAEYRYKPSMVTGRFRSNAAQSLDAWHLALDFGELPTLSNEFIRDDPPIDRAIAVPSEPHFIIDMHHKLKCARPMPLFGVPGNIDRF